MKNLNLFISDAKEFMANETNSLLIWIIIINVVVCLWIHHEINNVKLIMQSNNSKLIEQIEKVDKKVDFRYFNTTTSLEEIHHVKIDTRTGELKK